MTGKGTLPEPSNWEKKWKRREVIATGILAVAGILVALFLGWNQFRIAVAQKEIAAIGVQTTQNQALASHIIAMGNDSARVRRLAAIALADFGERAIPPLILALGDDSPETRLGAVYSLVCMYNMYNTPKVIEEVMKSFAEEKNQNVIEACVLILVKTEKFDELCAIITEAEWQPFTSVIVTLEQRKRYDLLGMLLEVKGLSVTDRMSIITAIGNIAGTIGEPVVQYLVKFSEIENLDENVWIKLIITLDNIMEKRSRDDDCASLIKPTLLGFLEHESDRVRANAVTALEKFCNQNEVREALQEVLQQEDEVKLVKDMARYVLDSKKYKKF